MNVSIVEEFGCHKRVEHLLLRRTLGVRLRCMSPFLADFVAEVRCKLFWSVIPSLVMRFATGAGDDGAAES